MLTVLFPSWRIGEVVRWHWRPLSRRQTWVEVVGALLHVASLGVSWIFRQEQPTTWDGRPLPITRLSGGCEVDISAELGADGSTWGVVDGRITGLAGGA